MQNHEPELKTIAVIGATGAQGGSLVRAIMSDPTGGFTARAITRNPDSPAAQELRAAGAEVVQADLDDRSSLEAAFSGAHGAFFLTNYWEHFSPDTERVQAENLAEAARTAGIQHGIWSTLEDTRELLDLSDDRMPTLQGHYKVPHMDSKGESDRFFLEAGVPTTFLIASFYWENMIFLGLGPQRAADGSLSLTLPLGSSMLPGIAVDDIGAAAYALFRRGAPIGSERIGIAGDHLTGEAMASTLSEALGEDVRYEAVPADVFRSFGFPGADDMGNMFQFIDDFNAESLAIRSLHATRELHPEAHTFASWLRAHAKRIPVA